MLDVVVAAERGRGMKPVTSTVAHVALIMTTR